MILLVYFAGLLEHPILPPTLQTISFKVYLSGKAGTGKSTLVSILNGNLTGSTLQTPVNHLGETPGLRVTQVFWPANIGEQILLFKLDLWDSGEAAGKKYGHILPVNI